MTEEDLLESEKRKRAEQSCLQRLVTKLKLTEEGATPPNWKYIGLIFAALFSSASTLTFLFPFLPEMILHFGYTENQKGFYAGLVASCIFGGRVAGSVFWGWLADRSGRKIVLLLTILLNGLFSGLFGFSTNLVMAMVLRFFCGLVNGTVATSKAVLYDISDNTNQAFSMSMLSVSWGLGMIVGPSLGGLLADPAKKWPSVFSSGGLFGQYPYLLPSIVPFFCCSFIFVLILFKFDETFVGTASKRRKNPEVTKEAQEESQHAKQQKDSYAPLLTTGGPSTHLGSSRPHMGLSTESIHVDADVAAFFAQEMLDKRKAAVKALRSAQSSSPHVKFVSVPDLTADSESSAAHQLSLSTPNIAEYPPSSSGNSVVLLSAVDSQAEKRNLQIKTSALVNGEIGRTDGGNGVPSDVAIIVPPVSKDNTSVVVDNVVRNNGTKSHNRLEDDGPEAQSAMEQQEQEQEGKVCSIIEVCCASACCLPCKKTSLYKMCRLANVWITISLYVIYSFAIIGVEDLFPVFASTRVDYGGLGFSTDMIGMAIGITFLPLLFLQVKLYPFLVSKMGIRKVFLISAFICLVACQSIPTVRVFNNQPVWLWVCLMAVQVPFKIASNCCFAGSALLINNAVTPDLAGQVNGLAMMVTACGRTLAPTVAGGLFSWSVTYGPEIGTPFDTGFPFFVVASMFLVTVVGGLWVDPRLDQQRK